MTPLERSRKVLAGLNVRALLEASDLPIEVATAIADRLEYPREAVIEECATVCDRSADQSHELLRQSPWSEYARACANEAESLAIAIRGLKKPASPTCENGESKG